MDFKLPDLGEGIHEGQILTVHVVEGQSINEDELLMEVETDKAAVEIPSPCTGKVVKVHVQDKQLVHVGDVMVTFDAGESSKTNPKKESVIESQEVIEQMHQTQRVDQPKVRTSPSNRKLARSLNVDLSTIQGTGSGGRITRQDIEQAAQAPKQSIAKVEQVTRPAIKVEQSIEGVHEQDEYGAIIRQPMSQARKSISKAMCLAWETVPHVTDCNDVDITAIDELRKTFHDPDNPNLKLTLLPFVIKAVCRSLTKYPILNATIDSETGDVLFRQYVNIAIGVDSERGLIAPVIRNADLLSV
ncbi:MAG: 2-oxo acid dehydrogenase subunit E2, partial [Phycisphaerales bacterium]|nr:2-oxo acid dehydrogenase subunit E2 [Phycisphaerales bacterium]